MEDEEERASLRPFLVFVPISALVLLTIAVSPLNPCQRGGYGEAWSDLAAIWIALVMLLTTFWILVRKTTPQIVEGRVFGASMFAWSMVAFLLGAVGVYSQGT